MDKKLFLVESTQRAMDLEPYFSSDWEVCSVYSPLIGRRFSFILISARCWQLEDKTSASKLRWMEYRNTLRTRLVPAGELIELR